MHVYTHIYVNVCVYTFIKPSLSITFHALSEDMDGQRLPLSLATWLSGQQRRLLLLLLLHLLSSSFSLPHSIALHLTCRWYALTTSIQILKKELFFITHLCPYIIAHMTHQQFIKSSNHDLHLLLSLLPDSCTSPPTSATPPSLPSLSTFPRLLHQSAPAWTKDSPPCSWQPRP